MPRPRPAYDKLRDEFQGALDRAGIKAKAEFTGDDGSVRLPPGTPPEAYRRLLEERAKLPGSSEKRVVYSPPGNVKRSAKHARMEFLKDLCQICAERFQRYSYFD
jgi:hypothetical protein